MARLEVARMWRITAAEPSGCMMWFDPDREIPMIKSPPPDSEDFYEGGALFVFEGTLMEEEGVPLEGGDAKTSEERPNAVPGAPPRDLPF